METTLITSLALFDLLFEQVEIERKRNQQVTVVISFSINMHKGSYAFTFTGHGSTYSTEPIPPVLDRLSCVIAD